MKLKELHDALRSIKAITIYADALLGDSFYYNKTKYVLREVTLILISDAYMGYIREISILVRDCTVFSMDYEKTAKERAIALQDVYDQYPAQQSNEIFHAVNEFVKKQSADMLIWTMFG